MEIAVEAVTWWRLRLREWRDAKVDDAEKLEWQDGEMNAYHLVPLQRMLEW